MVDVLGLHRLLCARERQQKEKNTWGYLLRLYHWLREQRERLKAKSLQQLLSRRAKEPRGSDYRTYWPVSISPSRTLTLPRLCSWHETESSRYSI